MKFIIHEHDKYCTGLKAMRFLEGLDPTKKWKVVIEPYSAQRTLSQNAYLHAVPIKIIAEFTGHSPDEVKDYLLGEAFGWEEYSVLDVLLKRPLRRSSSLNTKEFNWFLEWIEAWAVNTLGLLVPRPDDEVTP